MGCGSSSATATVGDPHVTSVFKGLKESLAGAKWAVSYKIVYKVKDNDTPYHFTYDEVCSRNIATQDKASEDLYAHFGVPDNIQLIGLYRSGVAGSPSTNDDDTTAITEFKKFLSNFFGDSFSVMFGTPEFITKTGLIPLVYTRKPTPPTAGGGQSRTGKPTAKKQQHDRWVPSPDGRTVAIAAGSRKGKGKKDTKEKRVYVNAARPGEERVCVYRLVSAGAAGAAGAAAGAGAPPPRRRRATYVRFR